MALDTALRYCGIVLEFVGLGLAASGIIETRRRYSTAPGAWRTLLNVLRRVVRKRPIEPAKGEMEVLGGSTSSDSHFAFAGFPDQRTSLPKLDDRIITLERQTQHLAQTMWEWSGLLHQEHRDLRRLIYEERLDWRRADLDIKRNMRLLASGGLRLEAWGLTSLFIGTVLSNASNEVATFLHWVV